MSYTFIFNYKGSKVSFEVESLRELKELGSVTDLVNLAVSYVENHEYDFTISHWGNVAKVQQEMCAPLAVPIELASFVTDLLKAKVQPRE